MIVMYYVVFNQSIENFYSIETEESYERAKNSPNVKVELFDTFNNQDEAFDCCEKMNDLIS